MKNLLSHHKELVAKYDLPVSKVYFFNNYMVSEIKEGVNLNFEGAADLRQLAITHFGNNQFACISNRVNSYSIEPTDYLKLEKVANLCGIAVVAHKNIDYKNVEIEKLFYNKPFEAFESIEQAISWVKNLV